MATRSRSNPARGKVSRVPRRPLGSRRSIVSGMAATAAVLATCATTSGSIAQSPCGPVDPTIAQRGTVRVFEDHSHDYAGDPTNHSVRGFIVACDSANHSIYVLASKAASDTIFLPGRSASRATSSRTDSTRRSTTPRPIRASFTSGSWTSPGRRRPCSSPARTRPVRRQAARCPVRWARSCGPSVRLMVRWHGSPAMRAVAGLGSISRWAGGRDASVPEDKRGSIPQTAGTRSASPRC